MSAPSPAPAPVPGPKKPIVIIPSGMSRRDIITAVLIAFAVIGFIAFAIVQMGSGQSGNLISGVVTGRSATGERETLLSLHRSGKQGVKSSTADTGYTLKVFVKDQNRTYEVMVERDVWEKKKDGDTLEFLRPPSEQQ